MVIKVKVFPRARINKISREGNFFKAKITAPAEKGKANKALIKLLAEHFEVSKSAVIIQSGEKRRVKTIEISRC
ncbi:MAG: DUF167 domain-containing protein [Patescibacteria group bacterium]